MYRASLDASLSTRTTAAKKKSFGKSFRPVVARYKRCILKAKTRFLASGLQAQLQFIFPIHMELCS